jgi:diaminohydroxyphosphoribosylaminopyrimidine deaminase / 5-amino-6-(5-phosphoribosylamino)uracil reductase
MEQNFKKYIRRCIDLALNGKEYTKTNPIVGCVIVHNDEIIGEGFHELYGGPHAEVNAINAVKQKSRLASSTLYVSLEPCAHMGKTPPCSDLIIAMRIPKVVIGSRDPNSLVAGKGIEKLKKAGIDVVEGILSKDCMAINNRFFTYHSKKRPYIVLKWAESSDGFIDIERPLGSSIGPNWISNPISRMLVHKWRSEENAIMVGTNTVVFDNPSLNTRLWPGNSPIRIILDRQARLTNEYKIFSQKIPTLIFSEKIQEDRPNISYIEINFSQNPLEQIVKHLWNVEIQSIMVEGGKKLLQSFIDAKLWDEARVFKGNTVFSSGLKAPQIPDISADIHQILNDRLFVYRNIEEDFQQH